MSVRPSTWNNLAPTARIFMKFDMYFSKICRENSSIINIWQEEQQLLYEKTYGHLGYPAEFFLEREMFQVKNCRQNQNTHFT